MPAFFVECMCLKNHVSEKFGGSSVGASSSKAVLKVLDAIGLELYAPGAQFSNLTGRFSKFTTERSCR
jgi:hypothetical protein